MSLDWMPAAKVLAPRPQTPQLKWHEMVETNLGIHTEQRDAIKTEWSFAIGLPTAEQFCL